MSTIPRTRPPAVPPAAAELIRTRLVAARREAGLTQAQLAERAGIAQASVAYVEVGRTTPALGTLYALAAALGLPVADLVAEPGRKK